jgi:hypothetical protein
MLRALGALWIAVAASAALASEPVAGCEPVAGRRPVCGFQNPEDLVALPGDEALIVSEYGAQDGSRPGDLALFVLATEERRILFRGGDATGPAVSGWGDPACPGPPSVAFSPHGIDLAPRPDGSLALAAVQHGGRESIELFEVSGSGSDWRLAWRGCWIPPEGAWLNEVVLLSDGTVMTSHMMPRPDTRRTGALQGTGWLLHWTPEDADHGTDATAGAAGVEAAGGWQRVAGSEIGLANGFELSPDERTIYLNSSLGDGLRRIDRATGSVTGHADLGPLDNTTWSPDAELLIAHLVPDEEKGFDVCDAAARAPCPIAFQILAVDPSTLASRVLFDGAGSPMGAGTVGLRVGDELFVGSFSGDRILRVDLRPGPTGP